MKKKYTLIILLFCLNLKIGWGQTWLPMAAGLGSGTEAVKAIAENPVTHEIYAGGTFTTPISYLAKWNGAAWEQVGTGINGPVYSLAFKNQELYIGGLFSTAGGVAVHNFVRFLSGVWSDIGGGFNDQVNCIYISSSSGTIYAGGKFSSSGTTAMIHVSKLVSNTWTPLGSGISAIVDALAEYNTVLFAGCENVSAPVQKFDGSNWSGVSGLSGGKVYALASFSNYLYAGGDFSTPIRTAAKYDGTNWSTIVTTFGTQDKIYALSARFNTVLYIAGTFSNLGIPGATASYIARINSPLTPIQTITQLTSTISGTVYAIGNQSGKVIAGGTYTTPASNIAMTSTTINVDEISDNIIDKNFFPNPVNVEAHLKITTKERLKNPELKIYDLQSRQMTNIAMLKSESTNEIEYVIDCGNLPAGNYFYVLSDNGQNVLYNQFIKQ